MDNKERIFLAVSKDGEHWERYGDRAVIDLVTDDPKGIICGDPQIIKIDDVHAHKTWFVRHQGKNYHFYCACNQKGERFIALATS